MNISNTIKCLFVGLIFVIGQLELNGQIYFSRDGNISFHSDAPLERIEANNQNASSVIDLESGQMEFAVLIKAFQFKKALMQEHFNENYLESDKFPKATFKGKFVGFTQDDLSKKQPFKVDINGILTIHGESKQIDATGIFEPTINGISGASTFKIAVSDFNIKIPKIVRENIAKEVKIEVQIDYVPIESNN